MYHNTIYTNIDPSKAIQYLKKLFIRNKIKLYYYKFTPKTS